MSHPIPVLLSRTLSGSVLVFVLESDIPIPLDITPNLAHKGAIEN